MSFKIIIACEQDPDCISKNDASFSLQHLESDGTMQTFYLLLMKKGSQEIIIKKENSLITLIKIPAGNIKHCSKNTTLIGF